MPESARTAPISLPVALSLEPPEAGVLTDLKARKRLPEAVLISEIVRFALFSLAHELPDLGSGTAFSDDLKEHFLGLKTTARLYKALIPEIQSTLVEARAMTDLAERQMADSR